MLGRSPGSCPNRCQATAGISVAASLRKKLLDTQFAYKYDRCMKAKALQIRSVPEALHRRLKVQAAASGKSLSEYLLAELRRVAERPTRDEMLTRLRSRQAVTLRPSAAELIAEDRLQE